jgi:5'-3' exonuclease
MSKSFDRLSQSDGSTLMIVDGLNLAFRYKHAKSTEFVDDYIRVVDSLKRSYKAGKVIIVADKGASKYRKEIYPEYKANRKEKFENQTEQEKAEFEAFFAEYERTLLQIEHGTDYPLIRFDGTEADDLAAYIVKHIKKYPNITNIWLVSSDKDWDLLVNEYTSRFSYVTRKETTFENWHTHYDCDIEQYISIKCLNGDSGDNVKGVDGVGPKRALDLVREYGSAFDIAAAIPIQSKYKYIQSLNQCRDLILLNYQLMDLLSYCDDAIGENTKQVDNILEIYLANR